MFERYLTWGRIIQVVLAGLRANRVRPYGRWCRGELRSPAAVKLMTVG
ncbi:MAG: hypothetical protein FWG65_03180 [Turicibacter sp.]|nr:hypothetical protein [Turicibacter sp.]